MGNCIRTEMWKAFHNKMMRSALLIGFGSNCNYRQ